MERFYDVLRSQRFSNMEYVMFLGILSFFFLLGNVSLAENYEFDFEFLKLRKEQERVERLESGVKARSFSSWITSGIAYTLSQIVPTE